MVIYQLQTKSGCRYYETLASAKRSIQEAIDDFKNENPVVTTTEHPKKDVLFETTIEYDGYWKNSRFKDVYRVSEIYVYS